MTKHTWIFAARFRRNAFGWRSDGPIQRIKEALSEIKQVARADPALGAEGAVTLLEKLSPALEHVDSSSGSLGTAVNRAIEALVPLIAKADVAPKVRQRWLERLWAAIEDDGMSYIESLSAHWGELCASPPVASAWADEFLPAVKHVWSPQAPGYGHFKGTSACLACLHAAGRSDELLALLEQAPRKSWHDRRWGVQALVAQGKPAEAIAYAEASRGLNQPDWEIARACEEILLSLHQHDEAYQRYALEATPGTTYVATFKAIARKYPDKPAADILRDLVASTPGSEGKWFAAAKDAGLFDLAIELVTRSPTDPRTLIRAADDHGTARPGFALACGLAALRWISLGYGHEMTGVEVLSAHAAALRAATQAGVDVQHVKDQVLAMSASPAPAGQFVRAALGYRLAG